MFQRTRVRDRESGTRTKERQYQDTLLGWSMLYGTGAPSHQNLMFIWRTKGRRTNPSTISHLPLVTGVLVDFIPLYLRVVHI